MSYEALGRPLRGARPSASQLASWRAVSTYVTEAQARRRAMANAAVGFPLGDYIACLVLPEDSMIHVGPVNAETGHCDLTGDPAVLLAAVVSIVRV